MDDPVGVNEVGFDPTSKWLTATRFAARLARFPDPGSRWNLCGRGMMNWTWQVKLAANRAAGLLRPPVFGRDGAQPYPMRHY
jgi:hypothetical protein